jgi:flagellar protein FlaG
MDINTSIAADTARRFEEASVQVKQRQRTAEVVEGLRANAAETRSILAEYADKTQNQAKQTAAALDDSEKKDLDKASEQIDRLFSSYTNRVMEISLDEETGRRVVKLKDRETGEVIRQIPPQEYLDMVSALNRVAQVLMKDLPKYI